MNKSEIEKWLKDHNITNYTIHPNLVVDVDDDVDLYNKNLELLPFQFGTVRKTFSCSYNNLTSLHHCPTTIHGGFYCNDNNLTSMQYCPTTVGGEFNCFLNPFEVIPKDCASWIKAIKVSATVYPQIETQATPQMTAMHKVMWEV